MPEGTVITEGATKLLVPETHSVNGPGRIESGSVFFNEQMAFNRDVSIMLLRAKRREIVVWVLLISYCRTVFRAARNSGMGRQVSRSTMRVLRPAKGRISSSTSFSGRSAPK